LSFDITCICRGVRLGSGEVHFLSLGVACARTGDADSPKIWYLIWN
jgi:hypothetical protein